jgi:hypothetical protein
MNRTTVGAESSDTASTSTTPAGPPTAPDQDAPTASSESPRSGHLAWWRRIDPAWGVQLLAIVPLLAMVSFVRASTKLQWFDYWTILPRIVNADGSLAESELFAYHEGHILAVPSVVYWLNYKLTSGLNTTLGLFVVALVLAQVLMLRWLLPRTSVIGRWMYGLLFVAIAALLFAPQGAHNFGRAMSGTAWLLANFFAVAALVVVARGPRLELSLLAALPFAVLATLSYGTGLMVWPALVVVVLVWRRWSPVLVLSTAAAAVAGGTFLWFYERPASQSALGSDPSDTARRIMQVLGSAIAPDRSTAVAVGAFALVLAGYLVLRAHQLDITSAAPWVALLTYAVLGATMIGFARGGVNGDDIGASSRYYSLSALCWSALLVLAALVFPRDGRFLVVTAFVGALAFVGGQPSMAEVRESNHRQDELSIAMDLGISQGYPFFWGYDRYQPLLEELGHYPFSEDYDLACGLAGTTLDRSSVDVAAPGVVGHLDGFTGAYNDSSVRLSGWMTSADSPVRCVLVIDRAFDVVGAGAYGIERPDLVQAGGAPGGNYDVGFDAVAYAGSDEYQVIGVLDDGRLVALSEVLTAEEANGSGAEE